MKCRKCDREAVFNMRRHKLALCADHYLKWFPAQVGRTIRKYKMFARDDSVLVAVSVGKDSLALWDILLDLGYHAEGLYIGLGIDGGFGYSDLSLQKIEGFMATRPKAVLHKEDIPETYGESIVASAPESWLHRIRDRKVSGRCRADNIGSPADIDGDAETLVEVIPPQVRTVGQGVAGRSYFGHESIPRPLEGLVGRRGRKVRRFGVAGEIGITVGVKGYRPALILGRAAQVGTVDRRAARGVQSGYESVVSSPLITGMVGSLRGEIS